MALGDLPDWMYASAKCVTNFLAAHGEALWRNDIGTADRVDLWPGTMKSPSALHEIRKALGVIVVHVREEHRV